ncbi:hypothetical protein LTR54_017908 [Friedmanniomyces endolithicus]|uniref:Uncharacterized protein n=1 Tax=Friedmanniomyces endolithicus TaxID=329885 RepID=A0AAN6F3I2_9PEZI|nr:hypothetical protein LTR82_017795 [Friedmanniomyces endolithicus]KAK0970799.1 hypothetical protein LTR54_017908 [Friedmanniomyces endolithicus]
MSLTPPYEDKYMPFNTPVGSGMMQAEPITTPWNGESKIGLALGALVPSLRTRE